MQEHGLHTDKLRNLLRSRVRVDLSVGFRNLRNCLAVSLPIQLRPRLEEVINLFVLTLHHLNVLLDHLRHLQLNPLLHSKPEIGHHAGLKV